MSKLLLLVFLLAAGPAASQLGLPAGVAQNAGIYNGTGGGCGTPVWSTTDKAATMSTDVCQTTVSHNNSAGTIGSIRGVNFQSTGKYYWEQTVISQALPSDANSLIGFGDSTASLTQYVGQNGNSWGYYHLGGGVFHNAAAVVTMNTATSGQIVGMAIDIDKQHCWWKVAAGNWNNDVTADPATDTRPIFCGGVVNVYAMTSMSQQKSSVISFDATPPSGFTAGIPNGGSIYVAGDTLDPVNVGKSVTVPAPSRLTALGNYVGNYSVVRSVNSFSSGKYYWEITATSLTASATGFGIANASHSLTAFLGSDSNSIGWETGGVWRANTNQGSAGTPANADTLSVAVDLTNNKIWFRRNCGNWDNNAAHDPATNNGGFSISTLTGPFYAAANFSGAADQATFNLGGSAFSCTVPSGFTGRV